MAMKRGEKGSISMDLPLTKTGIVGLDQLLGGGIPVGWSTILSGEPGAGKTCLSIGFLVQGIKEYDEPGIFCSFNEAKKELYLTQLGFGYDLQRLEAEKKFLLLDLSYGRALGDGQLALQQYKLDLPALTKKLKEAIDSIKAKRLVIDPLTIISLLFDDVREIRYNMFRFFDVIRRFGVTSLAIAETRGEDVYSVEEFLAAGIIRLYNERSGAKRQRGIEIIKMRGVNHKRGI
ncbi:MAG: ATPase domain-containing protein, partial [Candidatus Hodarchaeota archaeon]